jgi:hypothetical protein
MSSRAVDSYVNGSSEAVDAYVRDLEAAGFSLSGGTGGTGDTGGSSGDISIVLSEVETFAFTRPNHTGEISTFEVRLTDDVSIVSFWGYANQNAIGTGGTASLLLSPAQYPLLSRFVGQVDQIAIAYNSNTGNFSMMPIRITATAGIEGVNPPNMAVGSRWTWQFMLVLAST